MLDPAHRLPPGIKMLLGVKRKGRVLAESAGDPDVGSRQPPFLRLLVQAPRPNNGQSGINGHSSTSLAGGSPWGGTAAM